MQKYRGRDCNNVPEHSAQYIAHMEQKLVATEAKVELLQSNYERLSRLIEKHMSGQAAKLQQDQDQEEDE